MTNPYPALSKAVTLLLSLTLFIVGGFLLANHQKEDLDRRVILDLTDHQDTKVTRDTFSGKYLLVLFGFTSCEYVCPTGMKKLSDIMDALDSEDMTERVTPVFISVDPQRDEPAKINDYLRSYHKSFVGLTGDVSALVETTDSFDTFFTNHSPAHVEEGDITHSTVIYIVDRFSRLVGYVPISKSLHDSANAIRHLIAGAKSI